MRRVLVFTDSASFCYDVIADLKLAGLLNEVYVQMSPVQFRLGRYLKGMPRPRVIKRRMVDVVDRLNRPARRMSVDASDAVLQEVGAVPFIQFKEIRSLVNAEDAIVVVYGTRIAPPWVYKDAFQSINLHWGLSPYYRGVLCTDWAVINRDLNNIGFTLHELSNVVDGGQVITQGRVPVHAGDTVGSITTRLHYMAKAALIKAVAAAQHDRLESVPQDFSMGRTYRGVDWTVGTGISLHRRIPVSQQALTASGPELPIHVNPALSAELP
jgi:hypothetical protein